MASTAAMVFFCRPGRMSLRALLTGFLVWTVAVWTGAVCATVDAASSNKAGITRAFIFLFSLCGRKHSAGGSVRATDLRRKSSSCYARPGRARRRPYTGALRYPNSMHVHAGHAHSERTRRVLRVSLAVTMLYVVLLVIAGIRAHSLALLSEAGHNLSDFLALLLSLVAVYLEGRPPSATKTYGYRRAGVLAALLNALSLVVVSFLIFYEAFQRIQHPEQVRARVMIAVAAAGVVINGVIALLLWRSGRDGDVDVNVRSAPLHEVGDTLSTAAVIVGGFFILWTGQYWIDAALSFGICALILWSSFR